LERARKKSSKIVLNPKTAKTDFGCQILIMLIKEEKAWEGVHLDLYNESM
jgi:hypothetical protein